MLRLTLYALCVAPALSQWVTLTSEEALGVLLKRDSTCPDTSYTQCSDSNLPADFCCPKSSTCITLDNASSALCCPDNSDCSNIEPIPCDVSQQNVTAHPDTSIMTTKLNGTLVSCGSSSCCPFGYSCSDKDLCTIDKSSSSLASSSSASGAASATSTQGSASSSGSAAATTASSSGAAASGIDSTQPAEAHCNRFPAGAVVAGFFPGMFVGALLCLLGVVCIGRKSSRRPTSSSTIGSINKVSHFRGRSADGTIIGVSSPIPQQQSARTDFLRRGPASPPDSQSGLKRTASRVKSWFGPRGSTLPSPSNYHFSQANPYTLQDYHNAATVPPLPTAIPTTPPQQGRPGGTRREPSTESIKIYSPPSMINKPPNPNNRFQYPPPAEMSATPARNAKPTDRPTTTFTDIMQRSGFESGPPPLPRNHGV